ncbi:MAG TPA: LLM class flavin-dependent oxidoreductase [Blastocatellia bacterium]|nr:LLM class flavin-dependent oxidoreductase [Blastocatellia bacterium]
MRIKFGLALDFWSAKQPFEKRLDEYVGLLGLAARYGFDSVWAGENRPSGNEPGHTPSPFLVLAALARSTRLRLGTGVALVTIQQPLQLAYDAVMLDHLAAGRFVLGAGLGSPPLMKRYGVNPDESAARMDELLASLKALWAGADKFEGRYFKVRGKVLPAPYTPGGPPILVAGKVQRSVERAVEYGAGWYGATQYHFALVKKQAERYREKLAASGKDPESGIVAVNRTTFVAETDDEARGEGRPYVSHVLNSYASYSALTDASGNPLSPGPDIFEATGDDHYFCGAPESVLTSIRKYVEAGVNQFNLRVSMGDMPIEVAARTVTLLGEQVLTHFKS